MKKITTILLVLIVGLSSCGNKPEFNIDGVDYYTKRQCIKDTVYHSMGYRYGLSYRGKYEWSFGSIINHKCLESKIDTLKCN